MAVAPHARSLRGLESAGVLQVAACWSPSEARRRAFAAATGFPVCNTLDAIVQDRSIDAALVLTPPNARQALVEPLAQAGKHILSEKPLERTTAAAEHLVAVCEAAQVKLGVVLQQRFRPASLRLRHVLLEDALGDPAVIQLAVPWWRPQSYYDEPGRGTLARDGGGVLISQAIHTLDLMLSLAGPVASVAAVGGTSALHRMETEDTGGRRAALRQWRLRQHVRLHRVLSRHGRDAVPWPARAAPRRSPPGLCMSPGMMGGPSSMRATHRPAAGPTRWHSRTMPTVR
ncbi:MAG: Gfo/Idh/MocA family oxidoreductase [Acetobacteraceae bacterium]